MLVLELLFCGCICGRNRFVLFARLEKDLIFYRTCLNVKVPGSVYLCTLVLVFTVLLSKNPFFWLNFLGTNSTTRWKPVDVYFYLADETPCCIAIT